MSLFTFDNAKLAAEAAGVFGIVLVFWQHPGVRKVRQRAALRPIAIAVACLFVLEAAAQITTRNQYKYPQTHEPFPFTRWAMFAGFTHSLDSGLLYDWRGLTSPGNCVELNPARLYVTPNAVVLFSKTHSLGDQIPADGQPAEPAVTKALDAFAAGLLARYNVLYPEAPLVQIELWRRTLPLQPDAAVPNAFTVPESKLVYTFTSVRP
ncbi:MAG: hypothetical protein B7Z37_12075 [Verrucomicrobia bacterium 12-59-8]|nr:MAG: hypothetical protein B7Z37_12075 [Verrucomicrobia bacterium 12-59-8]